MMVCEKSWGSGFKPVKNGFSPKIIAMFVGCRTTHSIVVIFMTVGGGLGRTRAASVILCRRHFWGRRWVGYSSSASVFEKSDIENSHIAFIDKLAGKCYVWARFWSCFQFLRPSLPPKATLTLLLEYSAIPTLNRLLLLRSLLAYDQTHVYPVLRWCHHHNQIIINWCQVCLTCSSVAKSYSR